MPTYRRLNSTFLPEAVMVGCIGAWIGSVFALFPAPASLRSPAWPDGLMVACATVSAVVSLARVLPAQNIAAAIAVAFIVTGATFGGFVFEVFSAARLHYGVSLGPTISGRLPWIQFPVWLVLLLTARGVAGLIVRPARGGGRYGFWLIGVTALLVVGLAAGVELMATEVKSYWRWESSAGRGYWNGLFWPALALWLVAAVGFQLLALPWLVSKRPGEPPPDWHPLILWFLVNLWIIAGSSTRGWLGLAGSTVALTAITTALAVRGGMAYTRRGGADRKDRARDDALA